MGRECRQTLPTIDRDCASAPTYNRRWGPSKISYLGTKRADQSSAIPLQPLKRRPRSIDRGAHHRICGYSRFAAFASAPAAAAPHAEVDVEGTRHGPRPACVACRLVWLMYFAKMANIKIALGF